MVVYDRDAERDEGCCTIAPEVVEREGAVRNSKGDVLKEGYDLRTGVLAEFMDAINKDPRSYESRGLILVKNLNVDPRLQSYSYSYVFRFKGAVVFINDLPRREETLLLISSQNPKRSKSELLNMVNNGVVTGESK